MRAARQPWTNEEKKLLVSTILKNVKQGKTLRESYEYVAKKTQRNANTVKHYWHEVLRHNYLKELEEAKKFAEQMQHDIQVVSQQKGDSKQVHTSKGYSYAVGGLFPKKVDKLNGNDQIADQNEEIKMVSVKQIQSEQPTTKLQKLLNMVCGLEEENLTVINSGQEEIDFIVINKEQDFGYIVNTKDNKVLKCNCSHDNNICKHMLKVALDKNLEIF